MALTGLLRGNTGRTAWIYIGVGALSLVKAIALRNDRNRFRRELFDAAVFLGVGLALRRFTTMKRQKRDAVREAVPSWLGGDQPTPDGIRERAMDRFAGPQPDTREQRTLADRARRLVTA